MAYGYYPTFQPYQNPYQNPYQQLQMPQQQPQAQGIQNGGFISVRSIEEALNWPLAPGNSLMFKDENSPYVYTKTRGFSQLDQPVFEKYRLVKEEDSQPQQPVQAHDFGEDIAALWEQVRQLQTDVKQLRGPEKQQRRKRDEQPDGPAPDVS